MFNNLNIKKKLVIALLIPTLALVLFVFQSMISSFNEYTKIIKLKHLLNDNIHISSLIHELQKERGLSTGFIGSSNQNFKQNLDKQRKLTDEKIVLLFKHLSENTKLQITPALKDLKNIIQIRIQLDSNKTTFQKTKNYYTNLNSKLIDFISKFSSISNNNKITQITIAYINLLKAKEISGIERAILSNTFASGKIDYQTFKEFSILNASHKAYINNYKSLLNKQQLLTFNTKMSDTSILEVEKLREIAFSKIEKNKIISDVKALAGYGGLIHNFKNYLLRGDTKYRNRFQSNYNHIQSLLNKYNKLSTSTAKEQELVSVISSTFTNYKLGLDKVIHAYSKNQDIKSLDKIVKVDDSYAINAIDILSNNILGADASYWFKVSTTRINILRTLELELVNKITQEMDIFINNIKYSLIFNLIITLVLVIIVFILSFKIILSITKSINDFQHGLMNFFNYLLHKTNRIEPIIINTNDELGQMANLINKSIEDTTQYLDKRVEDELLKNKEKDDLIIQNSKLASMGEMIGNIAHQWRQPLSVISTAATSMKIQKEYNLLTDELFINSCNTINDNAQYLSETIDDFKNFIKGDRNKKVFLLTDTINTFLQLVEGPKKSHNINIVLELKEDIKIDSYENELIQCLINIFNNAKDALDEVTKERLIIISTSIKNNKAIIHIKDNAGGIPNDILPKIFEPYFTTKHQSQGTGLGLNMSYTLIVEGMNGNIQAVNTNFVYNTKKLFWCTI